MESQLPKVYKFKFGLEKKLRHRPSGCFVMVTSCCTVQLPSAPSPALHRQRIAKRRRRGVHGLVKKLPSELRVCHVRIFCGLGGILTTSATWLAAVPLASTLAEWPVSGREPSLNLHGEALPIHDEPLFPDSLFAGGHLQGVPGHTSVERAPRARARGARSRGRLCRPGHTSARRSSAPAAPRAAPAPGYLSDARCRRLYTTYYT